MTATLAIIVAASLMVVARPAAQQPASPPAAPATAPAAAAPDAAAPAADAAAQEPLPSAAEIIKQNIDARGGEASLLRHRP